MAKNSLVVIQVEEHPVLSLEELCHACGVAPEFIQEMIEHGALEPQGYSIETWRFDADQLRRIRTAIHLHQDLEVNLAGAALVLDLMDQIEEMRSRLAIFEKIHL